MNIANEKPVAFNDFISVLKELEPLPRYEILGTETGIESILGRTLERQPPNLSGSLLAGIPVKLSPWMPDNVLCLDSDTEMMFIYLDSGKTVTLKKPMMNHMVSVDGMRAGFSCNPINDQFVKMRFDLP